MQCHTKIYWALLSCEERQSTPNGTSQIGGDGYPILLCRYTSWTFWSHFNNWYSECIIRAFIQWHTECCFTIQLHLSMFSRSHCLIRTGVNRVILLPLFIEIKENSKFFFFLINIIVFNTFCCCCWRPLLLYLMKMNRNVTVRFKHF